MPPLPDAAIDLRSDTVTRPTPAMREAMASASVGDDQYGEDPTSNALQARVAKLLGKEAALWLPSGTMANQVALRTLTRPGDDVIVSGESHAVWHETGAGAANAGVQFTEIGERGLFTAEAFASACKPRNHVIYPPTTLVEIENTHNRAGGVIFPQGDVRHICTAAREREVASFLDGARLWNVAIATRTPLAELAEPFDLVAVALSKGLGAPGGSLLAGSHGLIGSALGARLQADGLPVLGAEAFAERSTPCCYDPAFQAGYPKTPVFDSGSRPAELFLFLAGARYSPAAATISW